MENNNNMNFDPMTGRPLNNQTPPPQPQQGSQQQGYQQPYQQPYRAPQQQYYPQPDQTVGVGEWMLAMLLMVIPIVNIIALFAFAFGSSKASKRNYFKACLIWMLIAIVLTIVIVIIVAVTGASLFSDLGNMGRYYY